MKKPRDEVQTIVLTQPLDYVVEEHDHNYERARVFGPLGCTGTRELGNYCGLHPGGQ